MVLLYSHVEVCSMLQWVLSFPTAEDLASCSSQVLMLITLQLNRDGLYDHPHVQKHTDDMILSRYAAHRSIVTSRT